MAQKYGRPNEETPAKWNTEYKDFNAPLENGSAAKPLAETTSKADVLSAPAIAPVPQVSEESAAAIAETNGDSKKRKRHDGESAEEKAERKKKKKEKKEKRASKAGAADDESD